MADAVDIAGVMKHLVWLDANTLGERMVAQAVRRRMKSLGASADEYVMLLDQIPDELQHLTGELIVPETFFYRHEKAFQALGRWASIERARAHPDKTFLALSAACSTGEEAYTIAMALLNAGLRRERIRVDAFDISSECIRRAKQAVYGSSSFRNQDGKTARDIYFTVNGRGHELSPAVKSLVNFQQRDIFSGDMAQLADSYDAIFCRNVMIYFTESARKRAYEILKSILARDGVLFLGPSDAPLALKAGFALCDWSMAFAVRQGHPSAADQPKTMKLPASGPARTCAAKVAARPASARVKPPDRIKPGESQISASSAPPSLDEAFRLADLGRFGEAMSILREHLASKTPQARAFYLLGLISDSAGDKTGAEQAYRKALYLQPDHEESLLSLCLLLECAGRMAAAAPLRQRLGRIAGGPR
ncbi:MAG: CheR family methyltransferase [bacterium]